MIELMLFLSVACVCGTFIYLRFMDHQHELHKESLAKALESKAVLNAKEAIERHDKEFHDYKKKVDALTVRAGFTSRV